jgi:hypothetical protein
MKYTYDEDACEGNVNLFASEIGGDEEPHPKARKIDGKVFITVAKRSGCLYYNSLLTALCDVPVHMSSWTVFSYGILFRTSRAVFSCGLFVQPSRTVFSYSLLVQSSRTDFSYGLLVQSTSQ